MKQVTKYMQTSAIAGFALALTLPATAAQLGQDARAAIPKDVQQLIVVDYHAMQNSQAAMDLKARVLPPELKQLEQGLTDAELEAIVRAANLPKTDVGVDEVLVWTAPKLDDAADALAARLGQKTKSKKDVPEGAVMVGIPARATMVEGGQTDKAFVPYGTPCSEIFDPATQKMELMRCELETLRKRLDALLAQHEDLRDRA